MSGGELLTAWARSILSGEDSEEAEAGGVLLATFVRVMIQANTKPKT